MRGYASTKPELPALQSQLNQGHFAAVPVRSLSLMKPGISNLTGGVSANLNVKKSVNHSTFLRTSTGTTMEAWPASRGNGWSTLGTVTF